MLKQFRTLIDVSEADGDVTTTINTQSDRLTGLLFVEVTGTVSVDYSIRNPDDTAWIVAGTYTADTVVEVPVGKKVRVDTGTTVGSSEDVKVSLLY